LFVRKPIEVDGQNATTALSGLILNVFRRSV
jgi:hypothetical protein